MITARRLLPPVYYGVLTVLLALTVTGTLGDVFPRLLAKHIGEDSEGVLLALLLPLWIQYARPRLRGHPQEWPITLLAAAGLLAAGLVCYGVDAVPPRIGTLNETLLALAVLVPYVQLARPVPRALAYGLPGGVLLLVLVASGTGLVTDLAEGLGILVLAPIGLDVVDRVVLDRERREPVPQRWPWYAFLVVAPALIALAGRPGGAAGTALRYAERVQESFVGVLLLEVYLVLVLVLAARRKGRARTPA